MSQNAKPEYQLTALNHDVDDLELTIWQMPCPASPHLTKPLRVGRLRGRNYTLAESALLKTLKHTGIKIAPKPGEKQKFAITEETALALGLLCKTLAPMRNMERIRQVVYGIERMAQPEAAYWLGMAMHRKNTSRVLAALRVLLTA